MMSPYYNLRQAVFDANLALPAFDLVVFTWGNVSAVDREQGVMAIKPSGIEYDALTVEDIVVLSLEDGSIVEGSKKPSSDTATHLYLYQQFPGISGITHTHSRYAVSWAQAYRDLPAYGTTHADHFYGPVPCTRELTDDEIRNDYELNTGVVIAETFRERTIDPVAVPAVLVAGHGPFAFGTSAMDSVHNAVVLNECCLMATHTEQNKPDIQPIPQSLLDKHYFRKHGANAYYGQD